MNKTDTLPRFNNANELCLYMASVLDLHGGWPEIPFTPNEKSMACDETRRPMTFMELAEHYKRKPSLAKLCREAHSAFLRTPEGKAEQVAKRWENEQARGKAWEATAYKEHDARTKDAKHTMRGKKVLKAASQSGTARAKQYRAKAHAAQVELKEYLQKNPCVSLTAARDRIAKEHGLSRRTLERHASNRASKK